MKEEDRKCIDIFELWCWERVLKIPGVAKTNKWIIEQIKPAFSFKVQIFLICYVKAYLSGEAYNARKDGGRKQENNQQQDKWT